MGGRRRGRPFPSGDQATLFSSEPAAHILVGLDGLKWPGQERFPINRQNERVRRLLVDDLAESEAFLAIAGYSSIGELIELLSTWDGNQSNAGVARLLFGTEPYGSDAKSFADPKSRFTDEVRDYWLQHNVSVLRSAKVLQAIELLERGAVSTRFVAGDTQLHAKVYVGADAATIGSSNYTRNGLSRQIEANARFELKGDANRYKELSSVAENYWEVAEPWDTEFLELLNMLLRVVSWQEALARACAELLEGDWASSYLQTESAEVRALWPSQRAGIAQALWIIENVGSVLVADATGSGKTRMGAHLVRAVRDRLWSTGRIRRDITALVCPPAVLDTWRIEGMKSGIQLHPVSHGILSRPISQGPSIEHQTVREAQLLAVDEAHNFLNSASNRTRTLREHLADHVMLFTATPISRGAGDLLDLVALLGADNFEDSTIDVLNRLQRVRRRAEAVMTEEEVAQLRREIARFTLRRTKAQINHLVARSAEEYVHPETGRTCRYPDHVPQVYETGETQNDAVVANRIRSDAGELLGLALLPRKIALPEWLRKRYSDEQWLKFRLASAAGLAQHQVLNSLRSSRAALTEHLLGTEAAVARFELKRSFKSAATSGMIVKLGELADTGPPDVAALTCEIPDWMTDPQKWTAACLAERDRYTEIVRVAGQISDAREVGKRDLLLNLAEEHDRVLVFDHSLVTLALFEQLLGGGGSKVLMATGQQSKQARKAFARALAPDSTKRAIALCSDAMNEGLNLQGASVVVHLDLPTTLRVAEQRVGRVERMDSRHDTIESWWPSDGPAFATRANEKLTRRAEESESLLGSNLALPDLTRESKDDDDIVSVDSQIEEFQNSEVGDWDGIQDALAPIRGLVEGDDALIDAKTYEAFRHVDTRVLSYVTALQSNRRWAFLAVRATANGAPRWMLVEGDDAMTCEVDIGRISSRLRELLADDPPERALDQAALEWLETAVREAAREEHQLLPRKMIRALEQAREVIESWGAAAQREGDWELASRWERLRAATTPSPDGEEPDLYAVAEGWLTLVAPVLEEHQRRQHRKPRFTLLRDITGHLRTHPFQIDEVERHFSGVPIASPLAERVSACIISLPAAKAPRVSHPSSSV